MNQSIPISTSSWYTKIWRIVTENLMIHVYIDTERMIDNNHSSHNVFIVSLIFPIDVSTLLKNYDMVFFLYRIPYYMYLDRCISGCDIKMPWNNPRLSHVSSICGYITHEIHS